ncbi:MAG: hypothetical protein ACOYNZ_06080 [Rhodoferax sp.]
MSTALFALSDIHAPLQRLWAWFRPKTAVRPAHARKDLPLREASRLSAQKPLRIVRILELDQAPTQVGRMIISGRMADVCAELDRLAALH